MKLKNKIEKLKDQVSEINLEIRQLQETCAHPIEALEIMAKSSRGNYDPSCDCYWVEAYCNECKLHMNFDLKDNPEEYKKYVGYISLRE